MADTLVKGLLTVNTTLSGEFTTSDGAILVAGNRCLVTAQTNPVLNGFWYVQTGAWTRDTDPHLEPGAGARVTHGNYYKFSTWVLNTDVDLIADTNAQVWELSYLHRGGVPTGSLERAAGTYEIQDKASGATAGTFQNPLLTVNSAGKITGISASNIVQSYIEGLDIEYLGPFEIKVYRGAAYIPGYNKIVTFNADTAFTPSRTASTTYYIYLYEVNGAGQIEVSTTAPGTAYVGAAKTKTGDTTRRYLGKLATNALNEYDSSTLETLSFATTISRGVIELADLAEARGGTDAVRAVTPAGLKYYDDQYHLATDTYTNMSTALTFYPIGVTIMYATGNVSNLPVSGQAYSVMTVRASTGQGYQIAQNTAISLQYFRRWINGTSSWDSWELLGGPKVYWRGLGASASIPASSFSRIDTYASAPDDADGQFNITTGRFTPTVNQLGIYAVSGAWYTSGVIADTEHARIAVARSGSVVGQSGKFQQSTGGTGVAASASIAAVIAVSSTADYLELWAYHTAGGARAISGTNTEAWFTGTRVGFL